MRGRAHVVVRVERTGGFAGIGRDWTADSADLTAEQAARLRDLVEAAIDAVDEAAEAVGEAVGEAADAVGDAADAVAETVRDGFDYQVSAQVGGRRHRWRGPAADVPAVRQLAEHVREVAFGA